jgi:methylisocitrate lyase
MNGARASLRDRLKKGETVVAPGAYDALTARLIEDLGFPAVYVGGYTTGAHLCTTEPLLTMIEQLDVAQRIARTVRLPVLVDAHTGFGDVVHAMRTVREFEFAGVAGIHIEDQVYPKRAAYHRGVKQVIPFDEALAKLKAALHARTDPDFLIVGRTDAYGAENGGLDEAIRRLDAFAQAGADALMPTCHDPEVVARIHAAVPQVPMVWLGGLGGLGVREISVDEARQIGCQLVWYPLDAIIAAIGAVNRLYRGLRQTGLASVPDFEESRHLVEKLIGLEEYVAVEAQTAEVP